MSYDFGVTSEATTVAEYLEGLPLDRRDAISAVLETVRNNLPPGYEEGMQYGHIGFYVPHSRYPAGYHCDPKQPLPAVGIASQKNHMAVYLFCVYGNADVKERFVAAYKATGKKLDMGAGCVRFQKLDQLPLDVLADTLKTITVDRFIESYEAVIPASKRKKAS